MTTPRIFFKKALVGWLAYAMTFGPGTPAAFAQMPDAQLTSNDYSNVPLPAKKRPNPNLIFAIDDSGSMDGEISIDANDGAAWYYTAGLTVGSATVDGKTQPGFFGLNFNDKQDASGPPNFNNAGGANGTWKKYVYLFPNGVCGTNCESRSYADDQHDHFVVSPSQQFGAYRNPEFNKQYYNPTITYLPWKPYNDGTNTCPSGTATGSGSSYLCSPGNANPDKARLHPIYGNTTVDLTRDINSNTSAGYYFRLYDGMRVLPNARYRRCQGANDGQNCENWQNNGGGILCVGGNAAAAKTACELGGVATSGDLTMAPNFDHVEMAVDFVPARLFITTDAKFVDASQYAALGFPKASGTDPTGKKEMYLVEIRSSNSKYPKFPGRTDCAGSTCTYAEELQNFANWFQYYRKRHMSLNAAIGNSLDGLNALRAGYFLFNNRVNVTMYDFDTIGDFTKNERRLLGLIYRTKGNGGTPTRESLDHMGNQYKRTNSGAPITHQCQFNSGFIITDGFATSGGPTGYGNYDSANAGAKGPIGSGYTDPNTETVLPERAADAGFFNQQMDDKSMLPDPRGSGKIAPYADKWSDTMADMAMKFYVENLRPDIKITGKVPIDMNDIAPDADKNPNLHMNTYGLVLGLSGMIFGNTSTQAFIDQTKDPYKNNPDWNGMDPRTGQRGPWAIDELWHATINGRGQMLKADSPEQTRNAVLDVVNNVVAKGGAAAAVSVSNAIPTQGDNFTYQTKYNAGVWAGDLEAFTIDLVTGAVSKTPAWANSAQKQLADRDWKGRTIVTFHPKSGADGKGAGVPFRANTIEDKQLDALKGMVVGAQAVQPEWVLDWLRGDRSREAESLRSRGARRNPQSGNWDTTDGKVPAGIAVLGDLVNAEPLYVREPRFSYFDEGYAAYKSAPAQQNRTRVLYAPANDGMVHIFDALTGAEKWAYVPSFGFKPQTGFTTSGLRNLADKEYFSHRFMVDATPVVADVDFMKAGNTTTGSYDWRTIVVGGLGKGGRGWYAIDATSSDVADEADAAKKVLWEFPNFEKTDSNDVKNLGYAFGRPVVAKTRAAGWVVLIPSGYENGNETGGDGRNYLFVLNPRTGAVITRIATPDNDGAASDADRRANPRGMAHIAAFAGSPNTDATIDYVYGGDLYGNLWRFDLSGSNTSDWNVVKLATLTDGSTVQPITSEPELGVVGGSRVVYVGTGRYYGDKDIPGNTNGTPAEYASARGKQTIYALKDDRTTNPLITGRAQLVAQFVTKSNGFANVTNNAVDFDVVKGWYVDLPDLGERVITNPTLAAGALAITANIPDGGDACLPGGRSWLYAFDYRTGSSLPGATYAGRFLGDALGSRVNMIRVGSGIKGLIRTSAGGTKVVDATAGSTAVSAKRKAWRELIQ